MAPDDNLETRSCSNTALKIQAVIRGFVDSLTEILNAEDLFGGETIVIGNVLCQTEELKNRLEQLRRLRTDTPSRVASGDKLAGSSGSSLHSKRARCANPEGEVGICRHFCKDHAELMDITLWETLPVEVVEHICALLPLSEIFEFLKLCKPWSRLPTARRFRQFCAKAYGDLFGIVMFSENSQSYRLAIFDPKHEEWSYLELSNLPSGDELVYGRDGGLMCVISHDFDRFEGPPCIHVFNPLTGDKKYIRVSSFTASIDRESELCAVLLQLIMDEELGCYKLVFVTQIINPSGETVYYSESYDSVNGLWSALDFGFVHGDGVLYDKRCHVCFDCRLKKFCSPAEYGKSVTNPHPHTYFPNVYPDLTFDPFCTFVRDHRFKLELVEDVEATTEEHLICEAQISESVWQNGWNETSMVKLAMELPYWGDEARLLACTRYVVIIIADVGYGSDCRHHMVLYDTVTSRDCVLPQFWTTTEVYYDQNFMDRNLQFMCDLKWDAIP
ncbi:hypothetical protein KC19_9G064200 [Ceratodon purpureus]|uniref:F-box domain-containing protein n=1 Tax=Ceratodon purpureus TaxID=3225 RepID=A0A8T0GUR7_CERPU|nr:hypothetical protein KC19_9G064200 [Ceratodon purpureus]